MKISKYYVLYRTNPARLGFATSETDKWVFYCTLNTFDEVKALVDDKDGLQFRIIKGVELDFIEETEEVVTRTTRVKSRKLKNA